MKMSIKLFMVSLFSAALLFGASGTGLASGGFTLKSLAGDYSIVKSLSGPDDVALIGVVTIGDDGQIGPGELRTILPVPGSGLYPVVECFIAVGGGAISVQPNGLGTASATLECPGITIDADYTLVVTDAQNKNRVTGMRFVVLTEQPTLPFITSYELSRLP